MKRFFSEVQKERVMKSQLDLLKQDLKDCSLLVKSKRYRGAYIFLFDSLERAFDLFFASKGEKPTSRQKEKNSFSGIFLLKLAGNLGAFITKEGVECTRIFF
jgi:hypothetical protein